MKLKVLNVTRRYGTSFKKVATGTSYDIFSLTYLVPVEPSKTSNSTYEGYGFEAREFPLLNETVLSQFADVKFPSDIDVVLEPDPRNPSRNVVTGIAK